MSSSTASASGFKLKGFSFTKKAEPKRAPVGTQIETKPDVETITTFDKNEGPKPVNLPTVDLGLDLAALKKQDEELARLREERRLAEMGRLGAGAASGNGAGESVMDEENGGINMRKAKPRDAAGRAEDGKTDEADRAAADAILAELRGAGEIDGEPGALGTNAANDHIVIEGLQQVNEEDANAPSIAAKKRKKAEDDEKLAKKRALFGGSSSSSARPKDTAATTTTSTDTTAPAADTKRPILADAARKTAGDDTRAEDYDKIAIADFGLAYLRGLGYDAKKHRVEMVSLTGQKKGLGLGAEDVLLPTDVLGRGGGKGGSKGGGATASSGSTAANGSANGAVEPSVPAANGGQQEPAAASTASAPAARRASSGPAQDSKTPPTWLRAGLVVKITDDRHAGYCKKGEIRDVAAVSNDKGKQRHFATVVVKGKKDKPDQVYEKIPEKYLEPTLPVDATEARRVRVREGRATEHEIVEIARVDKESNKVYLKSGEKCTLSEVCHFVA